MARAQVDKTRALETLFGVAERLEEAGDFRKAFDCLWAAAQLGHVGSQVNLGNFYAWGRGAKRDLRKAAFWYKKAYKNGESVGAHNLAIDRRNQGNTRSAVLWFKKAISMHNGEAYVALAKMYRAQRGGQRAAEDLLRRALRLGRDDISDCDKEEAKSILTKLLKLKRK
jgi:TPR repeat protein